VPVHQETLAVRTSGQGFSNITDEVQRVVARSRIQVGLCTVFVQHTSASLLLQENADPAVRRDLTRWMSELASPSRHWEHADEGPDDMPAHARSALTRTAETMPVGGGRLVLGTWQALYLWEHRSYSHARRLVVTVAGD
jgi:secondary thiamine-phosphate synthase enzyme